LARKSFYGESAAPLSIRHPGKTAPLVVSGWTLVVWILFAMGSGIGYVASVIMATLTGRRIAKSLSAAETEPRDVAVVAAHGLWSAALQLASAICRHYWPIALIAALVSRRCRHVVLVAAIIDGVVDWITRNGNAEDETKRVGLVTYVLLKRLDDIAYGAGLWTGVVRERHLGALKPQIRT
jgi:mycofactocin glycosyltransferase